MKNLIVVLILVIFLISSVAGEWDMVFFNDSTFEKSETDPLWVENETNKTNETLGQLETSVVFAEDFDNEKNSPRDFENALYIFVVVGMIVGFGFMIVNFFNGLLENYCYQFLGFNSKW